MNYPSFPITLLVGAIIKLYQKHNSFKAFLLILLITNSLALRTFNKYIDTVSSSHYTHTIFMDPVLFFYIAVPV